MNKVFIAYQIKYNLFIPGLWPDCAESGGGKKVKDTDQKMEDVLSCRKLLNEVRTFFQQKIHRDN